MEPLSSNNGPIRSRKNRIHSRRPYERTGTASTSVASTTNSNNIWLYINNMFGHLNNYFSNWLKRLTTTTTATTLEETTGLQRTITSPVSSKISTTFGLNQGNNKINPFWYKNFAQLRDQNPKSNSSLLESISSSLIKSTHLTSSTSHLNKKISTPTLDFNKTQEPKLSTTTMPSNEASTTASDEKSKSSNTPLLNSLPFSTTTTDYIKSKVVGSNPDSMDIDMGSATTITSHTTTVTDPAVASSITTPSVTNQKINTAITHTTKPWASSPNLSSNPSTPQTTPQTFGNNSLFGHQSIRKRSGDFFPQNTRNILINPKTGFVQKNPNESSMQFGSNGFDSGNSFGGVSGNGSGASFNFSVNVPRTSPP
ncbi:7226_t:CDS:2, partial [Entrophospora sp. SA101]